MNRALAKIVEKPFRPWLYGLGATVAAIVLWILEQTTEWIPFELLAIPAKLLLLGAFPFCLPTLSAALYRQPRRAALFAGFAIGVTAAAVALYLPWRDAFCRHFDDDVFHWYWSG